MSVEFAAFRPATPSEVSQSNGNFLWQIASGACNIVNIALNTLRLVTNKEDAFQWTPVLSFRVVTDLTLRLGLWPEQRFSSHFPNAAFNLYRFKDPVVMKALLSAHRHSDIFTHIKSYQLVFDMIPKVFPETKFTEEDFVLTCSEKNTLLYRSLFSGLMSDETAQNVVQEEVSKCLNDWAKAPQVNVTEESRILASNIISRILFGEAAGNTELSNAIFFTNHFLVKGISGTLSAEENQKFEEFCTIFRNETNKVVDKSPPPPFFKDKSELLTRAQKQALVFATFFAGQETAASLINNILYVLANNPEAQKELASKELSSDFLQRYLVQAIHDFTPAAAVGRKTTKPVCLEYKFKGEETTRKVIYPEGAQLGTSIFQLAQQNPDPATSHAGWMPFGTGPNRCPGMTLAENEIKTLVASLHHFLKNNGEMILIPTQTEVTQVAHFTLHLSEDIFISFKQRSDPSAAAAAASASETP
jgi:cytochrome P450